MEKDERFAHIRTDPKFRPVRKFKPKTKIDNRFQSMFKDKNFQVKYTIDKRGRPLNHSSAKALKDFYNISSEESDDEETITKEIKNKLHDLTVDYARGEATLQSESSSDDDDSDEANLNDPDEEIEHKWGELDNDAESTEEATRRLAACNMDWDRIRAVDLMVLFNSFLPPGGVIESVTIYPSEYGKKRMQEEEIKGPSELLKALDQDDDEEGEETEEGAKYHMEKLRQYQLNRLKYYYAVVVFDAPTSASKIYSECDGMEYESSSTKIDLRFIPDDMTFDNEAKEVCDKLPEVNKYQPRFFTTTALQQAKVDLTWDETDPDRVDIVQKLSGGKIDDIDQSDLHNYLALSSSDESTHNDNVEDENEDKNLNPIEKYKKLLQEIDDKEKKKKDGEVEMEVTWGIGLEEKTEELVKKRLEESQEKTPFQKYLDKRKEKRKDKKNKAKNESEREPDVEEESSDDDIPSDVDFNDPYFAEELKNNPEFKKKKNNDKNKVKDNKTINPELELLLMNEEDDGNKNHFSLSKIQKGEKSSSGKKKRKDKVEPQEDNNFEVDVNDSRFSALYTSHLYNIDPSDPHFKKTKGLTDLITEKLRRRHEVTQIQETVNEESVSRNKNAELSVLVKSVKRKTEAIVGNKNKKRC